MSSNAFTNPFSDSIIVGQNISASPIIKVQSVYDGKITQAALTEANVVPFVNAVVKHSKLASPIIKKFNDDDGKETVVVVNDNVEARVYVPLNEATAKRNLSMALANLEAHRQWISGEAKIRASKVSAEGLSQFEAAGLKLYNAFYGTAYLTWNGIGFGMGALPSTVAAWSKKAKVAHDELRTSKNGLAALANYNHDLLAAGLPEAKTWDEVRSLESRTSDAIVKAYMPEVTGQGGRNARVRGAAVAAHRGRFVHGLQSIAEIISNGFSIQNMERELDKALATDDALRTGPEAELALAAYNDNYRASCSTDYKSWGEVNGGNGVANSTLQTWIKKGAEAGRRRDAGLVYFNAQQGTKFGSWKDTGINDASYVAGWADLAEIASKLVPTNFTTPSVPMKASSISVPTIPNSRTYSPLGFGRL